MCYLHMALEAETGKEGIGEASKPFVVTLVDDYAEFY
jgi:hypothetical protein